MQTGGGGGGGSVGDTWTVWVPHIHLNTVTYGNGTFVVVGRGGIVLTFPDEDTWTERSSRTGYGLSLWRSGIGHTLSLWSSVAGKDLNGITYGNSRFVAVGDWGTILTSPDGINWTARESGTSKWLYGVAYGNGTFVAVGGDVFYYGDGSIILTSPDGITWTRRTSGMGNILYGVTYGNNTFVAVGKDGTFLTSPDGINWTRWILRAPAPPARGFWQRRQRRYLKAIRWLRSVAYVNDTFVVVGSEGTLFTSPDGENWMPQTSGTSANLNGVAYGNGLFVVVGDGGTILTSSDGTTWTARGSGTHSSLSSVAYGNNTFVAVEGEGAILTSP